MSEFSPEGFSEYRDLRFPDENFPLAPDSVRDTFRLFWQETNCSLEEIQKQQHDLVLTNTLTADFCDEYIDASVYTAAMLGPIFDALSDPDPVIALAADKAIRNFVADERNQPEDVIYILGLLSDRPVINDFWGHSVTELYADKPDLHHHLLTDDPYPVPDELWLSDAKLVPPKQMLELAKNVDIETLLTESIETLASLELDKVSNDSTTLQQMYKAESLLSPLCEIIGLDGLAMALRSRAIVLKHIFTGQLDRVEAATLAVEAQGSVHEYIERVQSLFGIVFGDNIHEQVIDHTTQHGIIIGEGLCTSKNLRVIWRRKSIGSYLEKRWRKDPEEEPLDVLGATVICHTVEEVGERLARIIDRSHDNENVKLTPTASRTEAAHVRGTIEYIETVRKALGFESIEAMKRFVDVKEVDADDYKVCKVTLVYAQPGQPDMRAEIQLMTEEDRIESRIGVPAHIFHKYEDYIRDEFDPKILKQIRARKGNLSKQGDHLNPSSFERAMALYEHFSAAA